MVILAEAPKPLRLGDYLTVRVYDSAIEAHFDDTRKPNGSPSPTVATGVGSGILNFKVDGCFMATSLSLRAAAHGAI